jgi:DNA mismatch endonuclease (patch repair protein)
MADVVDSATRSRMMSAIGGKDTQPELRVRRRLNAAGLRYRLHVKDLPGRPDIVFRAIKTAVFVHGCFWHQHTGCRFATTPATNGEFWSTKLKANVNRDQRINGQLRQENWSVIEVWECASDEDIDRVASMISERTRGSATKRSD